MKKNVENTNETRQEKMIQKAFRKGGLLFPETPEEVLEFEKRYGKTDIILPEELQEPSFITSKSPLQTKKKKLEAFENLAMAAREGSQLPTDILEKMKEDRDKAKRNKKK